MRCPKSIREDNPGISATAKSAPRSPVKITLDGDIYVPPLVYYKFVFRISGVFLGSLLNTQLSLGILIYGLYKKNIRAEALYEDDDVELNFTPMEFDLSHFRVLEVGMEVFCCCMPH